MYRWNPDRPREDRSSLTDLAADLLLGASCPGCRRPGARLCPSCRVELAAEAVGFAGREPSPPGFPPTVAGGAYAGVLRELVPAYKDHGARAAREPLADRIAAALVWLLAALGRPGERYVLVPVPSSARAVRERGLDHTLELARVASARLAREVGLRPPVRRWLRPRGRSVDQVGLAAGERLANRRESLEAVPVPGRGRIAILIDDVTTTGATLAAAAGALERAGIPVLGAAVAAATPRHRLTPERAAR